MISRLEKAFLGGILHDPSLLPDSLIRPSDLSSQDFSDLLQAIDELRKQGRAVDPMVVGAHTGRPELESLAFQCLLEAPTTAFTLGHAKVIRTEKCERDVVSALTEALDSSRPGPDRLALAKQLLSKVEVPDEGNSETMEEAMHATLNRLERLAESPKGLGVSTGLEKLDTILGGIQPGVMTVVAGRPSDGKSSLSACIARQCGVPVDYYSMEDTKDSLNCRLISQVSGVNLTKVMNANMSPEEWHKVNTAAGEIAQLDIDVDDSLPIDASRLLLGIERRARARKTKLIVVDYFQLLRLPSLRENRTNELGYISNALAGIARDLNVGIVVNAQLNRKTEEREEPQLRDLKDCGTLEQDAYAVIALRRTGGTITKAYVLKNKNGQTGIALLGWRPENVLFYNARPEEIRKNVKVSSW